MTREAATVLEIRNVSKSFEAVQAVRDVSLSIRENEFFALLGPSGCGKTTLLRMLAGFEKPSRGEILLDGKDISPIPPNRRPLNLMFQSYALFSHMTVRGNISYGLEMENLPKGEIQARVNDILETTRLTEAANRRPAQLSGGQRQRVALARALIKRPRVLLLDEPLAALDKKLRESMQLELKRLQNEVGVTFVVVTHDQEEALVMADRMAVLKDGVLMQVGSPHQVYEHPNNKFVAQFIGVMNFFDGETVDGGVKVKDEVLLGAVPPELGRGQAAAIAVRPERLEIANGAMPADHNRLSGQVVEIAYHGLDVTLSVRTPISEQAILVRVSANASDRFKFAAGQNLDIVWSATHSRIMAS